MTGTKRIFIGLSLSFTFKEKINEWKQLHLELPIHWRITQNLHLTLVRPWYERDLFRITKRFEQLSARKFNLEFTQVGSNTTRSGSGLVWIEANPTTELLELRKQLHAVVGQATPFVFKPHITLGKWQGKEYLVSEQFSYSESMIQVILYESFVHTKKTTYEPLVTIKLQ